MAIIRQDKIIDWSAIGRDKYLRNQEAPSLYNDPITTRDIRGGAEVVSRSGNIMPKAITRDKLGDDSLLVAMNINISSSNTIMIATGYDKSLNDYLYAVTWDGLDYYLRRFNTADMLSPYQDGYSVNLPSDANKDYILGVVVLETKVAVITQQYQGACKIYFYDFNLSYLSSITAPGFRFIDLANFVKNLVYDGQYFVHSIDNNVRLHIKQLEQDSYISIPFTNIIKQTFTTLAVGGNIKKIGVKLQNNDTLQRNAQVYLLDSNDNLLDSNSVTMAAGSAMQWYFVTLDRAVTASTTYKIKVYSDTPDVLLGLKDSNVYSGGQYYVNDTVDPNKDLAFQVFQDVPTTWKNKICRFSTSDYTLVDSFSYQAGYTQPPQLMAYDKKFFYGYNPADKKIIKFAIVDGAVVVASEQSTQETILGIMHFNNFLYITYTIGNTLVSVPISV